MSNYAQRAIDLVRAEKPDLDPELARLYGLLVLIHGDGTILEDVHDAWAIWRTTTDPDHKSLVPFGQLSAGVQELDREYRDAIQSAWNKLAEEIEL